MSEDADYLYALKLQKQLNGEAGSGDENEDEVIFASAEAPKKQSKYSEKNLDDNFLNRTQNLVHPQWETLDPTPDVFALFGRFDLKFFQGRLKCVTLEWSKRMYSCAGICYQRRNHFGMDVTIRLSEPLLKLRPRKDLVETMLHEMIHAYCFVLNIREGNGGHGPNFKKIMNAINKVAGTNITVYHTFHDEVDLYKQHWWRCNGVCQDRAPFFGYVKRTSNRAPGPNDQWWTQHHESCGGTFAKIKEPQKPKKQTTKNKKTAETKSDGTDLRKFFNTTTTESKPKTTKNTKNDAINKGAGDTLKIPTKVTGSGTLLLNPKAIAKPITKPNTKPSTKPSTNPNTKASTVQNTSTSSIATAFPPTSYPGLSTDPFNDSLRKSGGSNLGNVIGFSDIASSPSDSTGMGNSGHVISRAKKTPIMYGQGYSMTDEKTPPNARKRRSDSDIVDREHLRNVWSMRFPNSNEKKPSVNDDTDALIGDVKRRRISSDNSDKTAEKQKDEAVVIGNEKTKKSSNEAWEHIDDDVMCKNIKETVIEISDSDGDDSDFVVPETRLARRKPMSSQERQQAIKKEILDDSVNMNDEDIILIDDEYDDELGEAVTAANELSDTSVIDELFGEDTLLQEFERENDVVPSGSRYHRNPNNDIITCPICLGKMKRMEFEEHLNGCTGIVIKVAPPKVLPKKCDRAPQRRNTRQSAKDILRNAGYTEEDLAAIPSPSSPEDLDTSSGPETSSPVKDSKYSETPRQRRQRGLFKTTRQCPLCGQELEDSEISGHLDDCPGKSKKI